MNATAGYIAKENENTNSKRYILPPRPAVFRQLYLQ